MIHFGRSKLARESRQVVFAWLVKRMLDGLPGKLPEVTGTRGLRILGRVVFIQLERTGTW